jgi:hypothetical protein
VAADRRGRERERERERGALAAPLAARISRLDLLLRQLQLLLLRQPDMYSFVRSLLSLALSFPRSFPLFLSCKKPPCMHQCRELGEKERERGTHGYWYGRERGNRPISAEKEGTVGGEERVREEDIFFFFFFFSCTQSLKRPFT